VEQHTTGISIVQRSGESPRYQARCSCGWPGTEFADPAPADAEALEHLRLIHVAEFGET
jgi:hypothetical protein